LFVPDVQVSTYLSAAPEQALSLAARPTGRTADARAHSASVNAHGAAIGLDYLRPHDIRRTLAGSLDTPGVETVITTQTRALEIKSAVTCSTVASPLSGTLSHLHPVETPSEGRTGRLVGAHFPDVAVSASSTARTIRMSRMAKGQPCADELQPSISTHEVGGCDHPGTERNQR
jgi:hypothetical protein